MPYSITEYPLPYLKKTPPPKQEPPFSIKIKIPKYPPLSDFRSNILVYLKKNAKPQQSFKLMKVVKYFLFKPLPFTLVSSVGDYRLGDVFIDGKYIKPANNLFICCNLYLNTDLYRKIFHKIIACDLKLLSLDRHSLSYNDFKFLIFSGNLVNLEINKSEVVYNDGEKVPYEILLDHVPQLRQLQIYDYNLKPPSQKFIEKIRLSKLEELFLGVFNDEFDFETFLTSLKPKPKFQILSKYLQKKLLRFFNGNNFNVTFNFEEYPGFVTPKPDLKIKLAFMKSSTIDDKIDEYVYRMKAADAYNPNLLLFEILTPVVFPPLTTFGCYRSEILKFPDIENTEHNSFINFFVLFLGSLQNN